MRGLSRAPPRRASSGNAASAARALPQRSIRMRKVRGPTFSLRISRSQSSRWLSVSRCSLAMPPRACIIVLLLFYAELAAGSSRISRLPAGPDAPLRARKQAADIGVVLGPHQNREQGEELRLLEEAVEPQEEDRGDACDEGRERGVAGERRDREPHEAEDEGALPGEPDQDTDIGRHALAALELEPDRKQVAEEGTEPREHGEILSAEPIGHQHRGGALERVEDQRRSGESFAAGAQHIGGADVAGSDRADIPGAGEPREDEPERNRAEQIAETEGGRVIGQGERPVDGMEHGVVPRGGKRNRRQTYSYTVRPATMVRTTRPESRASSNGVFLHFDLRSSRSSTHGISRSTTITSAPLPGRSVPPGRSSNSAGRVDIALSRVLSSIAPECTSRRPATSMVSMPIAPGAASAKGSRLVSTSCGSWSDITVSIRPSATAATSAARSSSERSGGVSLQKVRYEPTSISLSVR